MALFLPRTGLVSRLADRTALLERSWPAKHHQAHMHLSPVRQPPRDRRAAQLCPPLVGNQVEHRCTVDAPAAFVSRDRTTGSWSLALCFYAVLVDFTSQVYRNPCLIGLVQAFRY
jgi:hypothetical protein